ncbi:MAG: hypothetical protein ACTSYQ_04775 [Candidatus Odinarchaeia archaeon]
MTEIGSKLLGWVVSLGIVFGMTFLFLPEGYSMLITWFEPVFGMNLYVILTEIYILLGPYTDLVHISILVGAALVGGLIAGTGKGGAAVALGTIFFGLILMIIFGALSAFTVMGNPTAQAQLMALAASPPAGVDLVTIITAPVIGDIVDSLLTYILGGFMGGFDIAALLGTVLQPIIIYLIVNIVLAIVVGIIGGKIGGYIAKPREKEVKKITEPSEEEALVPEYKPEEGVSL